MEAFETVELSTDLLIVGGGMAACGAAWEASYWAKKNNLSVLMVDKAAVDRSGAVAMGLSAINTYIGAGKGENSCEDFVSYVQNDQMGTIREDLVYDIARHVDSSVHLFEKWGLPMWKDAEGNYQRAGRWQIMINGESYKVIVAEATKNALGVDNIIERLFIVKLFTDANDPSRIAGAAGFSVRENKVYFIKAKAICCMCGGAVHIFRPRSVGEGLGRTWYPPWNAGSNYAMMAQVGAELAQMESRFIPTRFKDGYGPVGAWFLFFKASATNAFDEEYIHNLDILKPWAPYDSAKPVPTPLRNHQMMIECMEGRGPVSIRTERAIATLAEKYKDDPKAYKKKMKELEAEAWEDFLDMTISQALVWAGQNIFPEEKSSEMMAAEPYFIGSHASHAGMWVSGPADLAPPEWNWGYNRMTTIKGLFTAGDGVACSAHKFSSGSHAEGRIAAKAAIKFLVDNPGDVNFDASKFEEIKAEILKPLKTFEEGKGYTVTDDITPNYIRPKMFLFRLNKIMDEYAGGTSSWYTTNAAMLNRALEELRMLYEDSAFLGANGLHELMRAWENYHRMWTSEAHVRHLMFREETRYPGYYYRADFKEVLDQENWLVFTISKWDPATREWSIRKEPVQNWLGL
ncbi:MAG: adenylyl-sulfate reductase subunit alpha [Deltaproteobacteria bacterium]|jgi:adenylylsulfate reductase subunit A|nr:adenylyl-sulfate reductase subunit alpha [Deltaproteobacteria bacterium]